MPDAKIKNPTVVMSGGGDPVIESLTVTENGTYTVPSGVDGYSPVTVNVPSTDPVLITKTITANGNYSATDDNADGYSEVNVDVEDITSYISHGGEFLFQGANFSGMPNVTLRLPNYDIYSYSPGTSARQMFLEADYLESLSVIFPRTMVHTINLTGFVGRASSGGDGRHTLKHVYLEGNLKPSNMTSFASRATALISLVFDDIDCTSVSSFNNWLLNCTSLVTLKGFVNNTIPKSISLAQSSFLSNESIIDIANALNDSVTAQTITVHSDVYDKCSAIVGVVVNGIFAEDASGTTTLANFITTTKNWTLAK